jgi:hypothetical protein
MNFCESLLLPDLGENLAQHAPISTRADLEHLFAT